MGAGGVTRRVCAGAGRSGALVVGGRCRGRAALGALNLLEGLRREGRTGGSEFALKGCAARAAT